MGIEEIDVLIEKAEREMEREEMEKRIIQSNKVKTKKQKIKQIAPIQQRIQEIREHIQKLQGIKDSKIPFYEKLPKDSNFYKHYMSVLYQTRLHDATSKKVLEDRTMLVNAAATIPEPIPSHKLVKKFD